MKRFRSIYLICISLILLIPGGCYMSQYQKAGKTKISGVEYRELQAFSPGFEKALYKSDLSVNGHEFVGLMMIKAFENGSYKVAFFSELGLNFFDFELQPSADGNKMELQANNIYSQLDRKIILNSMEKYFSMLLSPGSGATVSETYLKKDGSRIITMLRSYKGRDAYLGRNLIEPYSEIVNIGGLFWKDRVAITLSAKKINNSPESILIEQAGLRLRFSLELVEKF